MISYIRPFGCHVTILDTLSVLGKFDGKSDEGFLVGYSLNSKAYRVYNLVIKRIEVNLHVNFLEEKPNVKGVRFRWMFDIDYLTDSMNYIPVSLENQANSHAGTSAVTNHAGTPEVTNSAGTLNTNASEEEDEAEELIIVPTPVHHTTATVGTKKPYTNLKEEASFRKELDEISQKHLGASLKNVATSTSAVNTSSEPVNTRQHDFDDTEMPELEIFHRPTQGIFNEASYDEEGVITDFNNLPTEVAFSPIPTLRIHSIHPQSQILGDPKSAVQTRSKDEPKKILEALNNESWVEAIQEEGIDYDEVFAPVARIEAIRLFLAFASYMVFVVYQMDVKSAFLYGTIDEDVFVSQPPSFVDPDHPKKVYKVVKALYGLHQAPRAWYATLLTFLEAHGYRRGTIDKTLFIKKDKKDIMLVQVFQMSSMGELIFFLGLQVKQSQTDLFISQDKYVADMLKKFDLASVKTTITPMETKMALTKDEEGADVDVNPKVLHLIAVKRIFKYLKGKPNLGLWYPRESPFDLEAFSDSDYAGANLDSKSTTAEYVAAANCYGQILWIQNQLLDYGFNFMNTKIYIDNESTICIVKNPVYNSKTKHIEIRHHFIRDAYEKKLIQVQKIHTNNNVAGLLTKAFDGPRFNFLVVNIGMAKHGFKDGLEHGLMTVVREKVTTGQAHPDVAQSQPSSSIIPSTSSPPVQSPTPIPASTPTPIPASTPIPIPIPTPIPASIPTPILETVPEPMKHTTDNLMKGTKSNQAYNGDADMVKLVKKVKEVERRRAKQVHIYSLDAKDLPERRRNKLCNKSKEELKVQFEAQQNTDKIVDLYHSNKIEANAELSRLSSKRLKSDEAKDDESTKKTGKRRKQMARKGLHTDLDKDDSEDSDEASEQDDYLLQDKKSY
ncbi:putative ribonuclease H-like domain-containing protein [Tanacetum coccineum]|uniref:Ribonuclease H-like domain-containing protein n=1 Tax=Tanacetum coccineum TaxID=301880 RepID=A0ABQ4X250_9ASTR